MPRSRSVALLSVASVLLLAFAAMGWCGGPVTTRAPGAEEQQPGTPPGPAPTAGDAVPGNLTMAPSWVPTSTPNGSNGKSPWVPYESLGLKQSAFSWGFRATYEPQMFGIDLALNFDITRIFYKGDVDQWTGITGHPILINGQGARSKLDFTTFTFSADLMGVGSMIAGPSRAIRIGPRVSWTQYSDTFKQENSVTGISDSRGHTAGMFGVGLVGWIDFLQLAGLEFGTTAGSAMSRVKFAASLGQGGSMRFTEWEVFLQLFKASNMYAAQMPMQVPMPTFMFEVGWVRYKFTQTISEDAFIPPLGFVRDENTNYYIDIPTVRGSFVF